MAGAIRFGQSYPNTALEDNAFNEVQLNTSSVMGAAMREAYLDTPEASMARYRELEVAMDNKREDATGDDIYYPGQEEWKEKFGHLPGLKYDPKVNMTGWKLIAERKQRELSNQFIMSHGSGSAWEKVGQFGVGAVASLASPIDIGLSFIPIVGEAKMAALVGRVGKVGARIMAGVAEGAVGASLTEPFAYLARTQEQADYDGWNSLQNIAFGAAFGATLRVGGGAVADFLKGRTQSTHMNATETALNQLMDDRQVNVEHVHAADPDFATPDYTHVGTDDLDPGTPGIQTAADIQNGGVGKSTEWQIANEGGGEGGLKLASDYDVLEASANLGKNNFDTLEQALKDQEVQAMLKAMGFHGYDLGGNLHMPFDRLDPKTGQVKAGKSPGQVSSHEDGTIDDLVEAADHVGITPEEFEGMADPMAVPAIAKKLLDLGFKTIEGIPIPNPAQPVIPKKVKAIKNEKPTGLLAENLADMAPATDYVPNHRISDADPKEFEEPFHLTDFEQLEGPKGSNPGGVFKDKQTGEKFYLKTTKAADGAKVIKNEYLANALYRYLGLRVFDQRLVIDGEANVTHVGSKMEQHFPVSKEELKVDDEFLRGFAVDAWLANWDVVASGNTARGMDNQVIRTDVGGALLYRAQGEQKGQNFGPQMVEFDTMRNPNHPKAGEVGKVFGVLKDDDPRLLDGVQTVLSLSHGKIKEMIQMAGIEGKTADKLFSTLIARQQWLANKYIKTHPNMVKDAYAFAKRHNEIFSSAHAKEFIADQAKLYSKALDDNDKAAMKFWQTSQGGPVGKSWSGLNNYLLNKVVKKLNDDPFYEKMAAQLDTALKKFSLTKSQIMFRSAKSWELFDGIEWGPKKDPQEFIGKVREFEGFTASTFSHSFAKTWPGDVMLRVVVPSGHPGMFMKAATSGLTNEAEFVLPRQTKMRLLSVSPLSGEGHKKWEAIVELLPYHEKQVFPGKKSFQEFLKQQAEGKTSLFDDVDLPELQEAASKPQAVLDLAEAQAHLDELMQEVDILKASEALSEADLKVLELADEGVKMADAHGKATMAAALCLKGKI